jgi:tetratricopeptide (TPR) repeat protein
MASTALPRSRPSAIPPRTRGGVSNFLYGFAAVLASVAVSAAPHIPPNDSTVLEHVPDVAATQKLAPLRARVSTHPEDLPSTLALAQGYLDIGRANADPRFVSYAEAALSPWLQHQHPDPAVLTLQASALQYLHRFDEALRLLDEALAVERFNAQAWLTKATILQVQGRFDAARQACRPLIQTSGHLIALTCLTAVNSLTGQLNASYTALRSVFTDDPRLERGVRVWILDQLGDMAQRLGDDCAATDYFLAALRANPNDGYTKGEYADVLLRQGREAEVMHLLQYDEAQDNLLLRLAIAATRLRIGDARRLSDEFQERYEAARRDGDTTHLREQARFLLEVRGQSRDALTIAARNWNVQREPADVRVYWAAAAGNAQEIQRVREWIQQTHYEDVVLGGLADPRTASPKVAIR